MTQKQPISPLPVNAPAMLANQTDERGVSGSGTDNVLLVLLTNEKGLGPADEEVYRTLVDRLRRDSQDVVMLQDFISTPPLRDTVTSEDGKAWILPVGLSGEVGSPEANAAYTRVADIVKNTVAGTTLTANLTGTAATIADFIDVSVRDQLQIELAIIVLLLVILLIIYRNPITMLLPLITIGASLADCADPGGWSRPVGSVGFEPDPRPPQRNAGRCGNGLRRLPHQPLSRLPAARCDSDRSGKERPELHRQSDRRVRGDSGRHLSSE